MKATDRQAEIDQIDTRLRALNAEANTLMKTRRNGPAIRKHIHAQLDAVHSRDHTDHLTALVSLADGGSESLLAVNLAIETVSGPAQVSLDLAPLIIRLLGKDAVAEALTRPLTDSAGAEAIRHSARAVAINAEVERLSSRRNELVPHEAPEEATEQELTAAAEAAYALRRSRG
ncbi:hypothetical protein LJR175_004391 [Variovorax sp. LjRoot175]|uniref:hypothetical protein n=1 Tax=Variovorax sp. LjRoot175 TaxID=3342276 RepID=UPI003ECE95D2